MTVQICAQVALFLLFCGSGVAAVWKSGVVVPEHRFNPVPVLGCLMVEVILVAVAIWGGGS